MLSCFVWLKMFAASISYILLNLHIVYIIYYVLKLYLSYKFLFKFNINLILEILKRYIIQVMLVCLCLSSHSRVSFCSRYCLGGSGVCGDPCLRRGFSQHLWMWYTSQRPPWWGLEVGWLQWGFGVWKHGVPGVCWCKRESAWRTLSNEPP